MKYPNGETVKLGDKVQLSNGDYGSIIFSIDTDEYSAEFPKIEWEYLNKGVMIKSNNGALIHYEDPNEEFVKFVET